MKTKFKIGDKVRFDCISSTLVFDPETRTTKETNIRSTGSLLGIVGKDRNDRLYVYTPDIGCPHGVYTNLNGWVKR